jgi:hypothetical protein
MGMDVTGYEFGADVTGYELGVDVTQIRILVGFFLNSKQIRI